MLTVRRQLSDEKIAVQNASAMLENAMLLRLSRRRIARLARLRGFAIAGIGLEASGGYERGAMRALLAAGVPGQPVQAETVCQSQRNSGEKIRSMRE